LPDQAERLQQLIQVTEVADASFGEDLWLIAERIMLFRLTRAGEQKRWELAAMVHLLRKIFSETQGEAKLPPDLIELDESAKNEFKGSAEAKLSLVFTTIVDMAESMNPEQLYRLIAALRKLQLPEPEVINTEPLDKAEEFLSESFKQDNDWELN
jgi:hypothetical protein